MAFASDSTSAPELHGPVTRAIRAMRTEPASTPARRGFLRGLLALPLVGGAVLFIGSPSAVAEPITDAALDSYVAFLAHEHRAALAERTIRAAERHVARGIASGMPCRPGYLAEVRERAWQAPAMFYFPDAPVVESVIAGANPSARAAIVLSAIGCDWR